ncbi:hypothetical protein CFR75_16005 [Komagataeibacter xylinus]|uniref:Transposase DDE domain-containing protein n=1 Tax=Komagataeibacter xylinus TaxID=28448 RepID=A0A318PIJ5_KOMXY|nr:hypothetical protein CFR75_16005 [Komagataeibacter xylinus]
MMPIRLSKRSKNGRSHRLSLQGKTDAIHEKISFQPYKNRDIIDCFFARLKQFRGIATRYDKLKSTFLAAAQLVSAIIRIN